jgi:TM2 domain-containing membrane protein YozV
VLAFLLGWMGIHFFYLGKTGWGIAFLLLFWTGIPFLVAPIQGIYYLCLSQNEFQRNCVKK